MSVKCLVNSLSRIRSVLPPPSSSNTAFLHHNFHKRCRQGLRSSSRGFVMCPHYSYNCPLVIRHYSSAAAVATPSLTSSFSSPLDPGKKYLYQNEENRNAENHLRSIPEYKDTFFSVPSSATLSQMKEGKKMNPSVEAFIEAAENSDNSSQSIVSSVNKGVMEDVMRNLKELSDLELFLVLHYLTYFAPCPSVDDSSYVEFFSSLDTECIRRMRGGGWDMNTLFQVADLWYGVKLVRFVKFYRELTTLCLKKCETLSKEHFIRFMYSLNLLRVLPHPMARLEIELYLQRKMDEMNHVEMGIIAMACFKTETQLQDQTVVEKLIRIGIREKAQLDSIYVSALAKFARYSCNRRMTRTLLEMQRAFLPELERLSVPACTHLALIGTKTMAGYLPLIHNVVSKVENNLKDARLKELERISLSMTMFDADCDSLGHKIVEELRNPERTEEIKEYGRCLPAILHYLSMRNILPHDLIDLVLSEQFQDAYYGGTSDIYKRELLCLDFCVELEGEKYKGSRLNLDTRNKILHSHVARIRRNQNLIVSAYQKSLKSVSHTLDAECRISGCYMISNLLPQHHCTKIVLCTDNQGNPVKVPSEYRDQLEQEIKRIPNDSKFLYHVLFLCNKNDIVGPTRKLSGSANLMAEQLKKLGYRVHVVYPPFIKESIQDAVRSLNAAAV